MVKHSVLIPFIGACAIAAACSGSGGSREVPVSPTAPDGTALPAPTVVSPSDDAQLDTLRPTLTVNNVSSGAGSRTYEFQVADNSGFALIPGRLASFAVAFTQSGVPEGSSGQTSVSVPTDLQPSTRYYWRARAIQGASVGAWSAASRFKTKIDSFKSGNQVFDILTNGRTVADMQSKVFFVLDDQSPGLKLDDSDSYLGYRISALPEGEVSFVTIRIKPTGDSSFAGQSKILLMQDGTGSSNLAGNQHRVLVDRFWDSGAVRFEFRNNNSGGDASTGGHSWLDHFAYFVKLEWRGGNARLRIFEGTSEAGATKVDLSTTYPGSYNPASQTIVIGSLYNDTMRDMRVSRVYIGPNPRPISLGSALNAQ